HQARAREALAQAREERAGAAAQVQHPRGIEADRLEVLDEALADLALQHRVGIVARGGAREGSPRGALVGRAPGCPRAHARHSASMAAACSTSARPWPAERDTRSREVSRGTVGGRMAGTSSPRSSNRAE